MPQRHRNATERAASDRDMRLDSLKGLAILLVLMLHLQPLKFAATSTAAIPRLLAAASVIAYQACYMAVPVLLLTSLYLYADRRAGRPGYLSRRSLRIGRVLAFWLVIYGTLGVYLGLREPFSGLASVLSFPFTDGALYFLTDLLMLTVITELLARGTEMVPERVGDWALHGVFWATVALTAVIEALMLRQTTWNLLNFLPAAPAALLLRRRQMRGWPIAVGLVTATVYEAWAIPAGRLELGPTEYARPILVFGAVLLFMIWSGAKWTRRPVLAWLGVNSLGIYLVHRLVMAGLVSRAGLGWSKVPVAWGFLLVSPGLTAATLLLTALILVLMNKSAAKRFVR
jgi:surface polysaccharide O-acyltransferase-like enzyme